MSASTGYVYLMAQAQLGDAQFSGGSPNKGQLLVPFLETSLHTINTATKSASITT